MQAHTLEKYEKLFARYPFDFILLSVHEVEDKEFCTFDAGRYASRELLSPDGLHPTISGTGWCRTDRHGHCPPDGNWHEDRCRR